MPLHTWLPFFLAAVAISLSPGPGAFAAMSAGMAHGWRGGRPIALGLMLGVWTQLLVVGVGLGALLAASTTAFTLVKWVGAAYLVWLGIQQWRAPVSPLQAVAAPDGGTARIGAAALMRRGWTVNALNPKGTVFLLAVVPQFIDPTLALAPQHLAIGATFGAVECVVMSGYVVLAARVLGLLRSPAQQRWLNRGFGGLFVAAGTALALFKRA